MLCFSTAAADAMRERLEDRLAGAYDELAVTTFHGFCARLLHDEALEAGLDPFATPVSASDRLAMLLERIDELPLRHHDLRGNPSATLGTIVQRIDRLKDELVSADDYAAWAADLPDERAREREFAALYARPRAAARRGRACSTSATSSCTRSGCCARRRTCASGSRAATGTCWSTSCRTRASPRACCCGCWWPGTATSAPPPTTTRRSTASAAPRPRTCTTSAPSGRQATVVRLEESFRSGEQILRAARAVVEPAPDRIEKALQRRAPAARSRSGAARPSARRRRRWRPRSSG